MFIEEIYSIFRSCLPESLTMFCSHLPKSSTMLSEYFFYVLLLLFYTVQCLNFCLVRRWDRFRLYWVGTKVHFFSL